MRLYLSKNVPKYMDEARATGKFEKDEEIAEEAFDMHMRQLAAIK